LPSEDTDLEMKDKISTGRDLYIVVLICSVFVVAIVSVYWQTVNFEFISLDDPRYVTENQIVRQGMSVEGIRWAFSEVYASNWHPLTWISHMLDLELFGMKPGMHHLTNVIFHIFNTMLLFIVLKRMTGAIWKSAALAALFALHPLHVESVAWISERKDVLSTFFWMLTMMGYLWYVHNRSIQRYLVVVFSYILGLISKPMLVTLPFVLLLLDFWPLNRLGTFKTVSMDGCNGKDKEGYEGRWSGLSSVILDKIPLIVLAMISSGVTFYAQRSWGAVSTLESLGLGARIANAIVSYVAYLEKMLWPFHLAIFYPYPDAIDPIVVILCALLLFLISAVALFVVKKLPYLMVGWLWYLGTLVPVIGIVQVGSQSMADRYTYIPFVGIFLMIVWGFADLFGRWRYGKAFFGVASAAVFALIMVAAWVQVGFWKNSETLFSHALDVTGNNYVAHNSLGLALFDRGDVDGAISHYRESLRINPAFSKAYINLGVALAEYKKDAEGALECYSKGLQLDSGNVSAHNNLGKLLDGLGRTDEAVKYFNEALRLKPDNVDAHTGLGTLLEGMGRTDEAIQHFNEALRINPDSVETLNNLGNVMLHKGNHDEAIRHYTRALKINPHQAEVYNNLGTAFIHKNNLNMAIEYYMAALKEDSGYAPAVKNLKSARINEKILKRSIIKIQEVIKSNPKDPALYTKLGGIYQHLGEYDEAIVQYQKAISLQPEMNQALYGLVLVYSSSQEYTKALDVLQNMRQSRPDSPEIYYNIACVYAKQNMVNESIVWLQQAVEKGFHDWKLLENDHDLENIRDTEYYENVIMHSIKDAARE